MKSGDSSIGSVLDGRTCVLYNPPGGVAHIFTLGLYNLEFTCTCVYKTMQKCGAQTYMYNIVVHCPDFNGCGVMGLIPPSTAAISQAGCGYRASPGRSVSR